MTHPPQNDVSQPTGPHQRVLQAVFDVFHARGEWPTFSEIDRQLYRVWGDEFDLVELLPALSLQYLHRDSPPGVPPRPDERLRLAVAGLRQCEGAGRELDLFLGVLQWMVQREAAYDPPVNKPDEPTVTSAEAAKALQLPPDTREHDLAVVHALLHEEPWLWSDATTGGPAQAHDDEQGNLIQEPRGWSFTLPRRLRRFRAVRTVDEYMAIRAELLTPPRQASAIPTSGGPRQPTRTDHTSPGPNSASPRPTPDPRKVFVVHGRDREARNALFSFLRDLDLHPLEWEELVATTGSASPFTGEVVARAFAEAQAVVVLFTPDDEARLHPSLHGPNEPRYETEPTGQARPNVLLEAGMALGANPNRTILVELGDLRPVSDLAGRNVVRPDATAGPLNALVQRLDAAGCRVNRANPAWVDPGRFANLAARSRQAAPNPPTGGALSRGQRRPGTAPTAAPPRRRVVELDPTSPAVTGAPWPPDEGVLRWPS